MCVSICISKPVVIRMYYIKLNGKQINFKWFKFVASNKVTSKLNKKSKNNLINTSPSTK